MGGIMDIKTKKVSKLSPEKVEKVIEVAKEVAPVVAEVAVELAPKGSKHDVKVKIGAALSILYIVADLIHHFI